MFNVGHFKKEQFYDTVETNNILQNLKSESESVFKLYLDRQIDRNWTILTYVYSIFVFNFGVQNHFSKFSKLIMKHPVLKPMSRSVLHESTKTSRNRFLSRHGINCVTTVIGWFVFMKALKGMQQCEKSLFVSRVVK